MILHYLAIASRVVQTPMLQFNVHAWTIFSIDPFCIYQQQWCSNCCQLQLHVAIFPPNICLSFRFSKYLLRGIAIRVPAHVLGSGSPITLAISFYQTARPIFAFIYYNHSVVHYFSGSLFSVTFRHKLYIHVCTGLIYNYTINYRMHAVRTASEGILRKPCKWLLHLCTHCQVEAAKRTSHF